MELKKINVEPPAVALHSFTDFGLHLPANALLFSIIIGVTTGLSPPGPLSLTPFPLALRS